ncbi:MAG: hypothetical protein H0U54_12390, partial [Acidobacteria bacterium]|nr:hypothetical protein [Acidobacteriota bacterium]
MPNFQKHFIKRFMPTAFSLIFFALAISLSQPVAQAQKKDGKNAPVVTLPTLKRTTSRHEVRRFAYGSSLTILGAPAGSITIEAWPRSEVDITAEIELFANTEEELALLATINSFTIDDDISHLRILTTGTHDKAFMRRVAKKFPKALLNLPWKIDYRI